MKPALAVVPPARAGVGVWDAFVEAFGEPAWLVDPVELRVLAVNAAALALVGRSRADAIGWPATTLLPTPEDIAFWEDAARGIATTLDTNVVLGRADGSVVHVERRATRLPGSADAPGPWLVVARDRTAERSARDERDQLVAELRATLEATADGLLVTDTAGRLRACNRRFAQMWAVPDELLAAHDDAAVFEWMRRSVADAADYQRRLVALAESPDAEGRDELVLRTGQVFERVTLPQTSRGRMLGRVWSFRDLSERVAAERRIESLVTTDALTGLPQRAQFVERVAQALALARRGADGFALLLLDLDRFKQINDGLGHRVGDRVLVEAAQRIDGCLRTGDVMARVSGDQFALLVHQADARGAERAARRVLEACARPYSLDGAAFTLTCSIGIALYATDGDTPGDLLRHAEAAMRRAKDSGRACFRFFAAQGSEPAQTDLRARVALEHAMRQALADRRFQLHYQPQVDLASGRVVGAEALLRWHDPVLGPVSPGQFIPVAEESGFIVALGDWVLDEAVRQATAWHAQGLALTVSINVSALQFLQAGFVGRVGEALRRAALPPSSLELELTESILVHDAEEALARLRALAQLGVRLAIDDFGTGYSSLAYLKRFPIERLKIDRSFVEGLPGDGSDAGIVRAIVQMACALDLQVTAEGVETELQRRFLLEAGCNECQGFLYAPALDVTAFVAYAARDLR